MTVRYWPLERGCQITSRFGWRAFDNAVHKGIDFGWDGGSGGRPVYAVQSGTVIHAGAAQGYGGPDPAGWLVVDSDDAQGGGCFEYGHLIREVPLGAKVTAGQRIGRINPNRNTNAGVDPHLHVSYWQRAFDGPEGKQDWTALLADAKYPGGEPASTPTPTSPGGTVANKPAYREIDRMGSSRSNRNGARISNFFLHTQEGGGTAESLAAYLNNPGNSASYHYTVRDSIVVDVVDTDYASWSVLDANPRSINLCFAGSYAGWGRADWLKLRDDVRIAAWLAVQDARKYKFGVEVIAPPYGGARDGISDHKYVTQVLRVGSHTDVGGFIWPEFAADVKEFTAPAPTVPVVNQIDEAARANPWLGARIDKGELACPDGRGRFAGFDAGYIYWTPTTGARPIPARLMESYAVYKWEAGALGYPTANPTKLPDGWVQAFEKGTLYRRDDAALGFIVTGRIGARWARDGFEKGALGWPISNEQHRPDGTVRQDFEHGAMYWSPDGVIIQADGAPAVTFQQVH